MVTSRTASEPEVSVLPFDFLVGACELVYGSDEHVTISCLLVDTVYFRCQLLVSISRGSFDSSSSPDSVMTKVSMRPAERGSLPREKIS